MGDGTSQGKPAKRLRLKRPDTCNTCGRDLKVGEEGFWSPNERTITCVECATDARPTDPSAQFAPVTTAAEPPRPPSFEPTVAGASARREHERRRAKDEQKLRDTWGPFGGLAVAMSSERTSTKVWARGAVGEEVVGGVLDKLRGDDVAVFHDLRVPRKTSNIDHIVVTRSTVWVIDSKRYHGKRPSLLVEGGILRPRTETLTVGGSRKGNLVDGVLKQVQVVSECVGDVPVSGALCFVDSDWPLFGGAFETQGVAVLWPKKLADRIRGDAAGPVDVLAVAHKIAAMFRPA